MTGDRIKKIEPYIKNDFCLTYGDAVSNVNLNKLIRFHFKKKSIFTMTGIVPISKYGSIKFNKNNQVLFGIDRQCARKMQR